MWRILNIAGSVLSTKLTNLNLYFSDLFTKHMDLNLSSSAFFHTSVGKPGFSQVALIRTSLKKTLAHLANSKILKFE